MKRRITSLLLVMLLVVAILPISAVADDSYLTKGVVENIVVSNPVYKDNTLIGITASFKWISGPVEDAYLVLSSKKLPGGDDGVNWGVFSSEGTISKGQSEQGLFKNFTEAKAYNTTNGNLYGFIADKAIGILNTNMVKNNLKFDFQATPISLSNDGIYYCYLWIVAAGECYPDNLIFVVQVKDGVLKFAPASKPTGSDLVHNAQWGTNIYRNYYNPIHFESLKNDSHTPPANPNLPTHTHQPSTWIWDNTTHWKLECVTPGCANNGQVISQGAHVYTDDRDPDCNTCGYVRNRPDNGPATGDITNIPLWTMLFFAGVAMMYVQLSSHKREQF